MGYLRRLSISALLMLIGLCVMDQSVQSFAPVYPTMISGRGLVWSPELAAVEGNKQGGKRKRRRKQQPGSEPSKSVTGAVETEEAPKLKATIPGNTLFQPDVSFPDDAMGAEKEKVAEEDLAAISDVAKFEFKGKDTFITKGVLDAPVVGTEPAETLDSSIPLPDIKEARKKKLMEEELARTEQEKEEQKVRIKRSDKEAFAKLLEQQPYADADASLFEEEEYGAVSALLGEKAKPFLGIPFGPLQVGHFIGALGIVLMAFVEYPGFPLTNLPTPLRECLQGGLATIYSINIVLAVLAAFKAQERGQSVPLWVVKTFSVGGLAFDQLTQLPTTTELERAKSVKGKRALKNRKR